jgi:hypothetical protein
LANGTVLSCDKKSLAEELKLKQGHSLCISMHALEEAPRSVMHHILSLVQDFNMFLFVFSGAKQIFEDFAASQNLKYVCNEFPTLKGHFILTGVKK